MYFTTFICKIGCFFAKKIERTSFLNDLFSKKLSKRVLPFTQFSKMQAKILRYYLSPHFFVFATQSIVYLLHIQFIEEHTERKFSYQAQ